MLTPVRNTTVNRITGTLAVGGADLFAATNLDLELRFRVVGGDDVTIVVTRVHTIVDSPDPDFDGVYADAVVSTTLSAGQSVVATIGDVIPNGSVHYDVEVSVIGAESLVVIESFGRVDVGISVPTTETLS